MLNMTIKSFILFLLPISLGVVFTIQTIVFFIVYNGNFYPKDKVDLLKLKIESSDFEYCGNLLIFNNQISPLSDSLKIRLVSTSTNYPIIPYIVKDIYGNYYYILLYSKAYYVIKDKMNYFKKQQQLKILTNDN